MGNGRPASALTERERISNKQSQTTQNNAACTWHKQEPRLVGHDFRTGAALADLPANQMRRQHSGEREEREAHPSPAACSSLLLKREPGHEDTSTPASGNVGTGEGAACGAAIGADAGAGEAKVGAVASSAVCGCERACNAAIALAIVGGEIAAAELATAGEKGTDARSAGAAKESGEPKLKGVANTLEIDAEDSVNGCADTDNGIATGCATEKSSGSAANAEMGIA